MKFNKILSGLSIVALSCIGFSSCSSELDSPDAVSVKAKYVNKAPKILAYSGNTFWDNNPLLAGTRGNNTNTNEWPDQWDCFPSIDDITQEDVAEIKRRLTKEYGSVNSIDFPYADFWVQQVYKGEEVYTPVDKDGNPCNQTLLGSDFMDEFGNLNGQGTRESVSNFNYGNNNSNPGQCPNCHKSMAGTTLKTDMLHEIIDPTVQFFFHDSFGSADYYNYYIIEYKGYYYLGFDYEMHKQANNPGEIKDVERDYKFTDWIVRIVPAYRKGLTPEDGNLGGILPGDWYNEVNGETPTNPQPGDGSDTDDDNGNGENNNDKPGNPSTATGDDHTNEVEVNLGIATKGEEKDSKYNESHLSIHVRSAVDVDLFIPMPLELVCPADDMEIVKKHLAGEMAHGGAFENAETDSDGKVIMQGGLLSKMTYMIPNPDGGTWDVSIYVEYVAAGTESAHGETFTQEGIHIWTEGLEGNTELMDYLQENYGDGITFEIWNYYDEESTLEQLKGYLDKTTISFIGGLPDYFINAFGKVNYEEGKDCTVSLEEETAANYEHVGTGSHLNGSSYNEIYENQAYKATQEND